MAVSRTLASARRALLDGAGAAAAAADQADADDVVALLA